MLRFLSNLCFVFIQTLLRFCIGNQVQCFCIVGQTTKKLVVFTNIYKYGDSQKYLEVGTIYKYCTRTRAYMHDDFASMKPRTWESLQEKLG